jgi:4,5-DOPA dioxygenase extradiol
MTIALLETEAPMPAFFMGHGNPMNAIEENEFSRSWREIGATIPHPSAILCISAHWQTAGTRLTAAEQPKTIHDFYGFPEELFAVQYPAPGSPALVRLVTEALHPLPVLADHEWGLDHGAWSVLIRMFPHADIPVVQLSLDANSPPSHHYQIGRALRPLRRRGVLIVGSGNIVHNLRLMCWEDTAFDWALRFDALVASHIMEGTHDPLIAYSDRGLDARRAIPTDEHYLPLLSILGLQEEGDPVRFYTEKVTSCSISMRSLRIG